MFTDNEILAYFRQMKVSEQAIAVINNIRSSEPSRLVQGGRGNVTVRFPSSKMGRVIQAESHKVELAYIYLREHDDRTYEYYDQPPPIHLSYISKNGRKI